MGWMQLTLRYLFVTAWAVVLTSGADKSKARSEHGANGGANGEFTTEVLAIKTKGPNPCNCLLTDARTRRLGGSSFVVGKLADVEGSTQPWVGSTVWIAADQIAFVTEYKSLSDARKAPISKPLGANKSGDREPSVGGTKTEVAFPPAGTEAEYEWPAGRTFRMPVAIDPARRAEVQRVMIYSSEDGGKTWKQTYECGPEGGAFDFVAPHDGWFWFAFQTVGRGGTKNPADVSALRPAHRVRINGGDSGPRPVAPTPAPSP